MEKLITYRGTTFIVLIFLILSYNEICTQTLAFPEAEGYGQFTTGGRGGIVLEVTNLNDSGPGSLRAAVETMGARTIVFRVSGTIELQSALKIKYKDLTIAGQTAPGDGICLRNYNVTIDADNIIVRYLRFRLGDVFNQEDDSFWGRNQSNIIVDHCSMSWSVDEASSFYDNRNYTMQWCILSESLYNSVHSKGPHGYGGIWGGWGATFHHNLFAHHTSRNPRFNGSRYTGQPDNEIVDFANNVIYNWGFNSAYGGEAGNQNIRSNYYKYGPATSTGVRSRIVEPSDTAGNWYIADNYVYGNTDVTSDNWNGGVQGSNAEYQKNKLISEPFPISPVDIQIPEQAFELVLENAGASFPRRDSIDSRIIEETKNGTAQYGSTYNGGGKGIIDSQTEVGGWPILNSLPAPLDSDHDGMPDAWENANGLNPNDDSDRNILNADGYTMLEVYINDLDAIIITSVESDDAVRPNFKLNQNYPNPFNPSTQISYDLNKAGNVSLVIVDVLGQVVDRLVNEYKKAGHYSIQWSPSNENGVQKSSSIYFAKLSSGTQSNLIKMLFLK